MYYVFNLKEFPRITQFYSVTRNTVWQITDKDHILIFIKDGSCSITFESEEYILNPGDIFFIPSNRSYTRRSINGTMCSMYYIHFSFSFDIEQMDLCDMEKKISDSRDILSEQILNGDAILYNPDEIYMQNKFAPENHTDIFQLLDHIQLFSSTRQIMCGLQSSISLCAILSFLSQHTIECVSNDVITKNPEKIPPNLRKAIRYIRSHYTEKITLEVLASQCNVSKQQLTRYFKNAFCVTPAAYITDYKIARAKELLFNQPQLSIGEISDELGFDNQHYFSRVFMKETGETPSHYRYRTVNYSE